MKNLKINIGCGMTPTAGWENFDNSISIKLASFPTLASLLHKAKLISPSQMDYISFCQNSNIRWADATKKIPLPNESVAVLYSSHMLEHLDRDEARSFLREAMRVLKPGGIIRLVVPDLAKAVEEYNHNKDGDEFIKTLLVCQANPKSLFARFRLALIGNRHHLWMYDTKSLSKFVRECGFKDPMSLSPGETTINRSDPLDLREREEESIYVEATKPEL